VTIARRPAVRRSIVPPQTSPGRGLAASQVRHDSLERPHTSSCQDRTDRLSSAVRAVARAASLRCPRFVRTDNVRSRQTWSPLAGTPCSGRPCKSLGTLPEPP
jgi:hypothetical protein